ncbi:MAG TPA: hypothetical protein VN838_16135 [Bradyrhizobium sp.]|nr:hypothetical protein [Bradyrhizobium sp.]
MTGPKLPGFQNVITTGQALQAFLIALVGAIYFVSAWTVDKDRNDKDLSNQIAGVSIQVSKLDGKSDALQSSVTALTGQQNVMDLRLKGVEETAVQNRMDRVETEKHLNEVDARVRVIEAMKDRK